MKKTLLLYSLILAVAGCKSTQVVNFSKGTGLDADIPIGYNGANLFELKLKVGQFYTATAVQPTSTNQMYTTPVSFASSTEGTVSAPQLTGGTGQAGVIGGDKFTAAIGGGTGSVTNLAGSATTGSK